MRLCYFMRSFCPLNQAIALSGSKQFRASRKPRNFPGFLYTCPQFSLHSPLAFLLAICQYVDMVCIYCGKPTSVTNSRHLNRSNQIWRRRACGACGSVFTTFESADVSSTVMVTRTGSASRLEPLSRDKLFVSLYESCRHRPTALKDAEALTATVINKALKQLQNGTLIKQDLQKIAQQTLKHFDSNAAVHYKAYYCHD
jgi:transcriptional repressor NrdR